MTDLPLTGGGTNGGFSIEGQVYQPESLPVADKRIASEGYFEAMRIPLIKGRFFAARDSAGAAQVAIVNETFVRRFLADEWFETSGTKDWGRPRSRRSTFRSGRFRPRR